ncbi:MAG: pentapeptide repeat-containing protein, partial [Fischerella sp.]|nr:pentapeptide repeat-containing protein [Fischerella sp.]
MTIANRKKIDWYEQAKARLILSVGQTALVGLIFIVMLLLTSGRPLTLTLGLSFCLAIVFVVWNQQKWLKKESQQRSASLAGNLSPNPLLDNGNLRNAEINKAKKTDVNGSILQEILKQRLGKQGWSNISLILADLSGSQLIGANLSGVYLNGTNLSDANL